MQNLVDQTELDIQTFHDAALRREIIGMFQREAPLLIKAIEASSGTARAELAHRLKGSALAIGARPLAGAADALESNPADAEALTALCRLLDATGHVLSKLVDN